MQFTINSLIGLPLDVVFDLVGSAPNKNRLVGLVEALFSLAMVIYYRILLQLELNRVESQQRHLEDEGRRISEEIEVTLRQSYQITEMREDIEGEVQEGELKVKKIRNEEVRNSVEIQLKEQKVIGLRDDFSKLQEKCREMTKADDGLTEKVPKITEGAEVLDQEVNKHKQRIENMKKIRSKRDYYLKHVVLGALRTTHSQISRAVALIDLSYHVFRLIKAHQNES